MDPSTSHGGMTFLSFNRRIQLFIVGAPAEQRCRYIFRFYNLKNNGNMSIEEFR
jgi:Ca2+-binding EF-hand superfamily protein